MWWPRLLNEARAPMLPSFAIFQIRRHLHIDYEIHDPLVRVVLIVSDFGSSVPAVASELSTKQQFFFFKVSKTKILLINFFAYILSTSPAAFSMTDDSAAHHQNSAIFV